MEYETHENIDDEINEDELYEIDKISLDEKYWRKRVFESVLKSIYQTKRPNGMNFIHDN